jgi:nucleoside-diphosphate-sugar epimerase
MNIWVTGMTGFLGRHVAAEVVKRGHVLVRREMNLVNVPENAQHLLPPVDVVFHCAAVCRWSREPHADGRFVQNVTMVESLRSIFVARRVAGLPPPVVVVPLPHGVLVPWNAYSSSAKACADLWRAIATQSSATRNVRLVYLPTLYGEDDPHHAKALPSFLLCATGRGESRMVLYGNAEARRQYLHVDEGVKALFDGMRLEAAEACVVRGEECSIEGLALMVMAASRSVGRILEAPERRPWQFRADGLGSPSPSRIGPDPDPRRACSEGELQRWIDETVQSRNSLLHAEKEKERERVKAMLRIAAAAAGLSPSGSSEDPSSW